MRQKKLTFRHARRHWGTDDPTAWAPVKQSNKRTHWIVVLYQIDTQMYLKKTTTTKIKAHSQNFGGWVFSSCSSASWSLWPFCEIKEKRLRALCLEAFIPVFNHLSLLRVKGWEGPILSQHALGLRQGNTLDRLPAQRAHTCACGWFRDSGAPGCIFSGCWGLPKGDVDESPREGLKRRRINVSRREWVEQNKTSTVETRRELKINKVCGSFR